MRPTHARFPGRIRPGPRLGKTAAAFALLLACVSVSCTEPTRSGDQVHSIAILVPGNTLRPGVIAFAEVELLDAEGRPVDAPVTWSSLTSATLDVGPTTGQLLAKRPGIGRVRASAGGAFAVLELQLVNPPVATLDIVPGDTLRLALPAGARKLVAAPRDADGGSIVGAPIAWESSAARIAAVGADGTVSARSAGRVSVVLHSEGLTDTVWVIVAPSESPTAPKITSVAPQVAVPGNVLQIDGARFASTPAGNTVLLDGIPVTVTGATSERLIVSLPAASAFACVPKGPVTLQVTTSGGIGTGTVTLQMAPQRALALGESVVLPDALESRCLELAPADGRYVVTVQNTARAMGPAPIAFTLGGSASAMNGGALLVQGEAQRVESTTAAMAATLTPRRANVLDMQTTFMRTNARRARAAHQRMLETNVERGGSRRAPAEVRAPTDQRTSAELRASTDLRAAALTTPNPGQIVSLRVLDLDVAPSQLCTRYANIGARTAFVGPHVVILEDTVPTYNGQPTLAGAMDDLYAQLGAEFESVVWPVLQSFGNPLIMDDELDDNDRIVLVFTPRMNEMLGGALFAVSTSCDLMSRNTWAASNVGEYFYAQVPTSTAAGPGPGTRESWMTDVRATIVHELKHVVSYAERTVRGQPYEEVWLEEATARHAEELYARAIYGTAQSGNHDYAAALRCEVRDGAAGCPANPPRAMLPHFDALWDFLDAPAARTPLGAAEPGDFSFYGSAWSLTRWLLDHSGVPEADAYRALTLSGDRGVNNLEARFGSNWPQMLGEWSLALATDDLDAFTPVSSRLRFPSWNLRSNFLGLCTELGPCVNPLLEPSLYPRPYPLQPVEVTAGTFSVEFPAVPSAGFGAVELVAGTTNTRQLLVLRGYQGAALPPEARISIVRVQ
ncbi:MAG TPA: IPT/TIG domain-containing protein [Gemmatimonadaceae bacterium]|nr:IPT/TIG domain-containing protein [Gemmatimonadaceae bacterium]